MVIENASYIHYSDTEGLQIGARTPIRDIGSYPPVENGFPILVEAADSIGDDATLEERLLRPEASLDFYPSLIALGAEAAVEDPGRTSVTPIEHLDNGTKAAGRLIEVRIPAVPPHCGAAYKKLPASGETPPLGVAVMVTLDPKHVQVLEARIVLGGLGPRPVRAGRAEDIVRGQPIGEQVIRRVAQAVSEEAERIFPGLSPAGREGLRKLTDQAIGDAIYLTQPDFFSGG